MIRIRVPATSANLGPGFDSLGLALSLYNTFRFEISDRLEIRGCDDAHSGVDNHFVRAFEAAWFILHAKDEAAAAGIQFEPPCVRLEIQADIPIARGLGSSAAMLAAGVGAAVALSRKGERKPFSEDEKDLILRIAAMLEGHPDNSAPAVYGGFCAAVTVPKAEDYAVARILSARSLLPEDWTFHALIPPFELPTSKAREALPETVPLKDAVFNLGHAALAAIAFSRGDITMLGEACRDAIHQPYRKVLIPGYEDVAATASASGADALWLSGAGPTIMALTAGREKAVAFADGIASALSRRAEGPWDYMALRPDNEGVLLDYE